MFKTLSPSSSALRPSRPPPPQSDVMRAPPPMRMHPHGVHACPARTTAPPLLSAAPTPSTSRRCLPRPLRRPPPPTPLTSDALKRPDVTARLPHVVAELHAPVQHAVRATTTSPAPRAVRKRCRTSSMTHCDPISVIYRIKLSTCLSPLCVVPHPQCNPPAPRPPRPVLYPTICASLLRMRAPCALTVPVQRERDIPQCRNCLCKLIYSPTLAEAVVRGGAGGWRG